MLSFSVQCYPTNSKILTKCSDAVQSNNSLLKTDEEEDDFLTDHTDELHQDNDFIYPALDVSDEDDYISQFRGKKKNDEAWNPKAQLGSLFPKINRPTRITAKKTTVDKCLKAAAKKLTKNYCAKRVSRTNKDRKSAATEKYPASKKTIDVVSTRKIKTLEPRLLCENLNLDAFPTILTESHRLENVKAKLAASVLVDQRPKKGMKTVKQRLGKILKIHRMFH
ncbi:lysine-specific demethylase phf2-like [Copidosoma floridanum]|uniref:lysine-specific demethylase phf2-like n=1 Tax=Copidosoma floridanum TaxID=29053 RepID=UPI0006C968D5|nr:lysine-specific demethylase phf2-like [Copidosoma floridanum]